LKTKGVAEAIEKKEFEKAMSLRDPEFIESLEGFFATSVLYKEPKLPAEKVSDCSLYCP
jgi:6-phosphofructokinase 1